MNHKQSYSSVVHYLLVYYRFHPYVNVVNAACVTEPFIAFLSNFLLRYISVCVYYINGNL